MLYAKISPPIQRGGGGPGYALFLHPRPSLEFLSQKIRLPKGDEFARSFTR